MNIIKADGHPTGPGKSEWFTGAVWNEVRVARVTFNPCAHTAWHTHPRGQILSAMLGVGRVQKAGGPMTLLLPGDSVTIAQLDLPRRCVAGPRRDGERLDHPMRQVEPDWGKESARLCHRCFHPV